MHARTESSQTSEDGGGGIEGLREGGKTESNCPGRIQQMATSRNAVIIIVLATNAKPSGKSCLVYQGNDYFI